MLPLAGGALRRPRMAPLTLRPEDGDESTVEHHRPDAEAHHEQTAQAVQQVDALAHLVAVRVDDPQGDDHQEAVERVELRRLHVLSGHQGHAETDLDEAQLKQKMVRISNVVIGVVDATKFGMAQFSAFALPAEIDRIITDTRAPATIVNDLVAQSMNVDLV